MGSAFNPHILVEKLAKLNNTQASIETLSHWCIFHMNKAKQVVETWGKEFHLSPRDQRLAFLHLANDILQNSRRKGADFVGEFWKVLPDCLRDVIENGDESGRNAALRLVGIWEERKVFGSRGQILKEELVRKNRENSNRNGKHLGSKLKQPVGGILDKVISDYQLVHGGQMDEDMILNKCRKVIGYLEQVERDIGSGDINSEQFHGASFVEELQGQRGVLRDSLEQLTALESSMASLVSHLREALQEKEAKLQQVRVQLQVAQSQSEHTDGLWQQLMHSNMKFTTEQSPKEANASMASERFTSGDGEQSAPSMYTRQVSFPENTSHVEEDPRKSAAAAVAAKLTASTSSAQMLSFVLSSLASEGVIVNPVKEQQDDYPPEKRAKHESDQLYIPTQAPSQMPLPPFQNPDSFHHNVTTSARQSTTTEPPPPPPSSPPPLPPLPPVQQPYTMAQYMQNTGSVNGVQYSYSLTQQQPSNPGYPTASNGMPMTGISPFTMPTATSYQSFQGSEGNLYNQSSSMPMAPISRQ